MVKKNRRRRKNRKRKQKPDLLSHQILRLHESIRTSKNKITVLRDQLVQLRTAVANASKEYKESQIFIHDFASKSTRQFSLFKNYEIPLKQCLTQKSQELKKTQKALCKLETSVQEMETKLKDKQYILAFGSLTARPPWAVNVR